MTFPSQNKYRNHETLLIWYTSRHSDSRGARTEHVVPLSRQAVDVLRELKALADKSQYVLPGRDLDKPIKTNTMLFALDRLGYKNRMTGHGFRAIASTILNESNFRPDVIERQLAHCERNDVRGAYNRAEYLADR